MANGVVQKVNPKEAKLCVDQTYCVDCTNVMKLSYAYTLSSISNIIQWAKHIPEV